VTSVQENDIHIHTGNTISPDRIGMACGKLSTCQVMGTTVHVSKYSGTISKWTLLLTFWTNLCTYANKLQTRTVLLQLWLYPTSVKLFCCM